jgi:hypothetical protein
MRNLLEELGEKHQPTKRNHDYLKHYWRHLGDRRLEVKKFIEIGIQSDRSINMWEEFFPNAKIYGIDIDPKCREFAGGRKEIFIGSQADRSFLAEVVEQVGSGIDVIIDDGSHVADHQIFTFGQLFPTLADNGIYVIEDTAGVVGDTGLKTVNMIKALVDHVYYWPEGFHGGNWPFLHRFPDGATWADRNIVGAAFYRWIAFVMRGSNPQDNPFLKVPGPGDTLLPNADGSMPEWLFNGREK